MLSIGRHPATSYSRGEEHRPRLIPAFDSGHPVSCRPTWPKPCKPPKPSHAHGRRRGFALPSDKPPNGRGNDLPRPAVRLDRVLFRFTRARNGALGYFWTLWAPDGGFFIDLQVTCKQACLCSTSHTCTALPSSPPVIKPKYGIARRAFTSLPAARQRVSA